MAKFKVNDRHVAFANAVASGMDQWIAYKEFMSPGKKAGKMGASVNASGLMKRPEIQALIEKARQARAEQITGVMSRNIPKEFNTALLTVDELDNFHSAVIQGLVEVEEVVPQYTFTETLNKDGKVVKRERVQNFVRVKRPPNIREKQISIAELYKRNGNYAPSRVFGAFGKLKGTDDEGEVENVERFLLLSNGEKIPLLP